MRRLLAVLVLSLVLVGPLRAGADDGAAIRATIQSQIEAFKADDAEAAFAHASPGIQRMFGDPKTFMRMVQEGYAPVYRPRSVEFGDLVREEGRLVQLVRVVGPDGVVVMAHYPMIQGSNGVWQIDGCHLERLPELSI